MLHGCILVCVQTNIRNRIRANRCVTVPGEQRCTEGVCGSAASIDLLASDWKYAYEPSEPRGLVNACSLAPRVRHQGPQRTSKREDSGMQKMVQELAQELSSAMRANPSPDLVRASVRSLLADDPEQGGGMRARPLGSARDRRGTAPGRPLQACATGGVRRLRAGLCGSRRPDDGDGRRVRLHGLGLRPAVGAPMGGRAVPGGSPE